VRLSYKWRAAIIVAVGLFMAVLDNTVVNVALTQMARSFNTDVETIKWVATAYFLAQAAVIPICGYLSDLIGTKIVFLSALALFTVGSGLCAIAPNEQLLIGFRIVQGVGGGALFPIAFAIIFRVFPPAERGPASAVIGVPVLLAPAFGPSIGGFLVTTFNWNAIFTVNLPIGVAALIFGALTLQGRDAERASLGTGPGGPEGPTTRRRFDLLGLLLSMAGFTAFVYGISHAGDPRAINSSTTLGWGDATVIAYLVVGVALLVAFVVNELLVSDPVIDVRLFRIYTFTSANVLTWAFSALFFGSVFLLPIFFQTVPNPPLTAFDAGAVFITQGLAAALATVVVGRLYNRIGPRILITLGFALAAVGTYGLTQFTVSTSGASVQGWLILRGLGLGFTNIPLQTLVVSAVSNRAMARASSLVNVMRQVAGAIGATLIFTFFSQQTLSAAPGAFKAFLASPAGQQAQAMCASQADGTSQAALQACVQNVARPYITAHSFTSGFNSTFVIVNIATAACIVLALFVGRDPNVVAVKEAAKRGEKVSHAARPAVVGE
jgi:EmrB/QacA subfamily drug resistance transporter